MPVMKDQNQTIQKRKNKIMIKTFKEFINESLFGSMADKGRGEVIKKEDEYSQYCSDEGRMKLANMMHKALQNAGYGDILYYNEAYKEKIEDANNTCPWNCPENKGDEEYGIIIFEDDIKFTWTLEDSISCTLCNLYCGTGLNNYYDDDYPDVSLSFDFKEDEDEYNHGDWQTLNYSFIDDTWFWGFNSEGELKPNEVDEFMAGILSIITPILNKNTQYTKQWFGI